MRNILILLLIISSFSSCKSSKQSKKSSSTKTVLKSNSKAENIISYANQFKGVRYKWGGTTKKGMDCSGLIFESFKAYDVFLPRISRDMAKQGNKVSLKNVVKGDLLFFKTGNKRNSINHVGLIVSIKNNNIQFIHATSSKGVITSWLNENYWHKAFFEARKIL